MAILDRVLGRESAGIDPAPDFELDTLFHILSNQRRRTVIRALIDDFDGSSSIRELAEFVAATEHPTATPETIGGQDRKRAYVSLYQTHVPKMAECGVIDYDDDAPLGEDGIKATELTRTLYRVLDDVEELLGGDE